MYERFTDRARKVMSLANTYAARRKSDTVEIIDLLIGIYKEGAGNGYKILEKSITSLDIINEIITFYELYLPSVFSSSKLALSKNSKEILENAIKKAKEFNHNYIGTEHLLIALVEYSNFKFINKDKVIEEFNNMFNKKYDDILESKDNKIYIKGTNILLSDVLRVIDYGKVSQWNIWSTCLPIDKKDYNV